MSGTAISGGSWKTIPVGRSRFWTAPGTVWQSNKVRFSRVWLENGWLVSRRRGRPDHEKRAISPGTAVPPLPLDIHTDRSGTAGRLYDLVHISPLPLFSYCWKRL